jgi:hypothetical protein
VKELPCRSEPGGGSTDRSGRRDGCAVQIGNGGVRRTASIVGTRGGGGVQREGAEGRRGWGAKEAAVLCTSGWMIVRTLTNTYTFEDN